MTNQPKPPDRTFSIGELVAYVTAWAIAFVVVAAAVRNRSSGPLAVMLVGALLCFTIAFLFRGREQALTWSVMGPAAFYLLAFFFAAVIPILFVILLVVLFVFGG